MEGGEEEEGGGRFVGDQWDPPDGWTLSIRGPLGQVCWHVGSVAVADNLLGCLSAHINVTMIRIKTDPMKCSRMSVLLLSGWTKDEVVYRSLCGAAKK